MFVQYNTPHFVVCQDPIPKTLFTAYHSYAIIPTLWAKKITPAINQSAADLSLAAVQAAKASGVTVSCDYNFRKKLWQYGKTAPEVMGELVKYVDVGIANEEDCQKSLGVVKALDFGRCQYRYGADF
jgi:sugar/nucleoside kinase (ribokinase family)